MEYLLPIAAKSFLVAGVVLLLLKLTQNRSASDRSWIAHLGLAAVLLLPVAAVGLPALEVAGPTFLAAQPEAIEPAAAASVADLKLDESKAEPAAAAGTFPDTAAVSSSTTSVDWGFRVYAVLAALLLLLTLIALGRLVALKARASVMVEPHWLTALARAQRRMGFKHGTALLTSNELPSPISWGVIRPVILLNEEAAESHAEAEAIIVHELAHVANLDWAKLLVARIAVAIFWFNPLVWLLAREAHQLREEAADDAVLGADIEDTEYAKLLVGVARHECRGLLIGAHGVAPAKNSLSRRVKRVLNAALERAPGGWRWSSAAAFFAAGMTVPIAALQFVSPTIATAAEQGRFVPAAAREPTGTVVQSAIATAVAESVTSAIAAAEPGWDEESGRDIAIEAAKAAAGKSKGAEDFAFRSVSGASISSKGGKIVLRGPSSATVTIYPPDSKGLQKLVMRAPNGAVTSYADARRVPGYEGFLVNGRSKGKRAHAVGMQALGVTPEWVASIRAAAPRLAKAHEEELIELRTLGVTPAYIRELGELGLGNLDTDSLVEAKAMNIRGNYIRSIAAMGYPNLDLDTLVEMRAVGLTAADIQRFRREGYPRLSADDLVELKATGRDPRIDHDQDDGDDP
jgi:bla regulator protein blaR1